MHTLTTLARRIFSVATLTIMTTAIQAWSLTDVYDVSATTGERIKLSKSKQIFGPSQGESASDLIDIGFTFVFDGTEYTEFSVSQAGLMSLGVRTESDDEDTHHFPGNSSIANHYPLLAAYWGEDLEPYEDGGSVRYEVQGSAPFRVLIVEWDDLQEFDNSSRHYATTQIRLYESYNRIEFWYGRMKGSSTSDEGSIGLVSEDRRYIHILGNSIPADIVTYPEDRTGRDYYLHREPISENTLYVFEPCTEFLLISGDAAEGGTTDMDEGDNLLTDKEVMRGSTEGFFPFTLENLEIGCGPISYSINFSGPHAGDYSASSGTIAVGRTATPEIRFRPTGHGVRTATMTISTSEKQTFTYEVSAEGLTRIDWIGIVEEGGVPGLPNNADLMTNIEQPRSTGEDYTPILIDNLNDDPNSTSTTITYTLNDPFGTYAISLDGNATPIEGTTVLRETIGPDGSSQPIITFVPHPDGFERGTGQQPATLTVEVDGLSRTFDLRAFGIDRALEIFADGERMLHGQRRLFRSDITCVGNEILTIPVVLDNVNRRSVTIEGVEFLMVDPKIRQGTPPYPLALDPFGQPVASIDYFFTNSPGIAPVPVNTQTTFPIELEPGETRTIYLNYVGQYPGRRYARLFFETDAVNLTDREIEGYLPGSDEIEEVEGLFSVDLLARAVGGQLATDLEGDLENLVIDFPQIRIGETTIDSTTIYNTGECDLVIAARAEHIAAGDVEEFEIIGMLGNVPQDADGNWVLAPGSSGTIIASFTPRGIGSRVATMKLPTNDSTLYNPGITPRGVYYVDLFGTGLADLIVEDISLEPTVIDGDPTDAAVILRNETGSLVRISDVRLTGPGVEAGEIVASPWPTFPIIIEPLSEIELGLEFIPSSGSEPGMREATVEVELESGEVIEATVTGLAGTRTLEAAPAMLFNGISIAPGETYRSFAVVTNTGTFPLQISNIEIMGPGAADYVFVPLTRTTIAPGGSEFIEVTYAPTAAGSSTAELVVSSNSTDGNVSITLSGESMGIGGLFDPTGSSSATRDDADVTATPRSGISSVSTATAVAGGMAVSEARPNPTSGRTVVEVIAQDEREVTIDLYDVRGTLIDRIYQGVVSGNSDEIEVNLDGLPEGAYFLRITSGSETTHRTLRLVR